jgi:hypothetical protein
MALIRVPKMVAACVAALALAGGLSACGKHDLGSEDEPGREGLSLPLGGVEYNIYITRELNLKITPDKAYYKGPAAAPGKVLYGVFIKACGGEKGKRASSLPTRNFVVKDNQGNEYRPKPLPVDDPFAYQPRKLSHEECIPQPGSVAQQGPTAGSMLLYEFPLQNTENRPLEMVIEGPIDSLLNPKRESLHIDLDI